MVYGFRRATPEDMEAARVRMLAHGHDRSDTQECVDEEDGRGRRGMRRN